MSEEGESAGAQSLLLTFEFLPFTRTVLRGDSEKGLMWGEMSRRFLCSNLSCSPCLCLKVAGGAETMRFAFGKNILVLGL